MPGHLPNRRRNPTLRVWARSVWTVRPDRRPDLATGDGRSLARLRGWCSPRPCRPALDGAVEGALRGGHHHRPVHRVRRLRRHLPARRHRLRARRGQVHAVPPRGRARPGRLHPRREGLHDVHAGVPAVPVVGAERRPPPVRPGARAGRDGRDLAAAAAHPGNRRVAAPARPGRRVRVGDAHLAARPRLHRGGDGVRRRGRRRLEGQARARPQPRRGPRHRRQPLHVLRQPARPPPGQGGGAEPARPRRHGLPDVVAADDVGPQGRQGLQAVRVQHRPAVLEDVRRRHLHRAVRGEVRAWPSPRW